MRPYTGYIEEKQRRLNSAILELENGPDNDYNMRYALRSIEELAKCIMDEAQIKQRDTLDRIIEREGSVDTTDYMAERHSLGKRIALRERMVR